MVLCHGEYIHDLFWKMSRETAEKIKGVEVDAATALSLFLLHLQLKKEQLLEINREDEEDMGLRSPACWDNYGFTNKAWRILAQKDDTLFILYKRDFTFDMYQIPAEVFLKTWKAFAWWRKDTQPSWPQL